MKPISLLKTLFVSVALLHTCSAFGQKNVLKFDASRCKSLNSFAEVEIIDKRPDKSLGFIQTGPFNTKHTIETERPLDKELEDYYQNAPKTETQGKKLVVILRNFFAYEQTGATSEQAYFIFAGDYFLTENNQDYRLLASIDTIITVQRLDVTKRLLTTIGDALCQFASIEFDATTKQTYSWDQLSDYEDFVKNSYPAYSIDDIPPGLFTKWKDFLQLKEKSDLTIVKKKKHRFFAAQQNRRGKTKLSRIVAAKIISYSDTLYYNSDGVYYPMVKRNNDFYFVGKSHQFINSAAVASAGVAFGLVGAAIASAGSTYIYLFRVNYRNGKLLPVKRLTIDDADKEIDELINEISVN